MPRRLLFAALFASLAAGSGGCGDDAGDDAATLDLGAGPRDLGFIRADLGFGDARPSDAAPGADAAPDDASPADALVDAGVVVGPDASPGPDANEMCTNGPRKPPPPGSLNIVNGTRQTTAFPLSPEQTMAVVGIGEGSAADCTGTLISSQVVLTAAHCTEGIPATNFEILFGQDDFNPVLTIAVTQKTEHPIEDLALLTLASDPSAQIPVQPIPIYRGLLSTSDEGRIVEAGGYGDTQSSSYGRFFAAVPIETVFGDSIEVNGGGVRGVCFGDSGGPALFLAPEGDVRVIGELSYGDAECAQRDTFVRVDVLRSYIEAATGPTPIAPNVDECTSLGTRGECAGQVARWCDQGVIRERDCASCGEVCLFLGDRLGFDCALDPLDCGELDFLGWCNGNVSEWCNEMGQRESYDCAGDGQSCGYVDAETGYYCLE